MEPPGRFEWMLAAEQGRYAETVRRIAELVRDEFSHFTSPPGQGLREKLDALETAVDALTEVGARIERLRMVAGAARRYAETEDDGERERAQRALLLALEELDRHVVPTAPSEQGVTSSPGRPPDGL